MSNNTLTTENSIQHFIKSNGVISAIDNAANAMSTTGMDLSEAISYFQGVVLDLIDDGYSTQQILSGLHKTAAIVNKE